MVTPEQAAAELEGKKDTHELWWMLHGFEDWIKSMRDRSYGFEPNTVGKYELRPKALKQVSWTGSREDVIALLKELEVLK
jgi:hypothetical protein